MTMPPRFTVVDDLERPDHAYLPADVRCYFWGEYTPQRLIEGPAWDYSPTNRLITNFKKKLDRRDQYDWRYKEQAIATVGTAFAAMLDWPALHGFGWAIVPVPPSKPRSDPMYDDRMMQVLQEIQNRRALVLDIRDCLSFSGAFASSHESDERPTPNQLYQNLEFDPVAGRIGSPPRGFFLLDDMLTTGAHLVAVRQRLRDEFGNLPVTGCFISRRRFPSPLAEP